jgi:glutathione peroxidase
MSTFHELTANRIDHQPQELGQYRGKVVLVVNTASACGFTPQYEGLEALYRRYRDQGLVVLGFPSNDFGAQEPGTEEQIQQFCSTRFNVSFPMFEKVSTRGSAQSPVYAYLSRGHGEPRWNFHKYLVDKHGEVVAAFPSNVAPDAPALSAAIETALAEPV